MKEQEIEKMAKIVHQWHVGSSEDWDRPDSWNGPPMSDYIECAQALYGAGYRNVNDMKLTSEEVTNLVWRDSPIGYKVDQAQLYTDKGGIQ